MRKWKTKSRYLRRGVFSRGGLSPRHAKTRQMEGENSPLINVSYLRLAGRTVATRKHEKVTIWRVFAWRPFAFSPRKHDNTTWHKSATILWRQFLQKWSRGFACDRVLHQNTISDFSIASWLLYTIYCCVRLPLLNLATRYLIISVKKFGIQWHFFCFKYCMQPNLDHIH